MKKVLFTTVMVCASFCKAQEKPFVIPPPPPTYVVAFCGWTCAVPDDPSTYPNSPLNCTKSAAYNLIVNECPAINNGNFGEYACAHWTFWDATNGPDIPSKTSETCAEVKTGITYTWPTGVDDETYPYCYPDDYWCS